MADPGTGTLLDDPIVPLDPPVYNLPGATYALTWYPHSLSLSLPAIIFPSLP